MFSLKPRLEVLEDRTLPSTIMLNFSSLPSAQGWTYVNGHSISPDYADVAESVFFNPQLDRIRSA